MPAIGPLVRVGWKAAPIALQVARQVDKHLRPHLRAYQLARSVGGYVGRWTANDGTHWVVFKTERGRPVQAFPPLPDAELAVVARDLDRSTLQRHDELPEDAVMRRLRSASRLVGRRGEEPIDLRDR